MSIGPLAIVGSAAGSPLAQAKGVDLDRVQQEVANRQREIQSGEKAENAAGVGATDGEDQRPEERDADGRRLWEVPLRHKAPQADGSEGEQARSRDATGTSGTQLDLSG